MRNNILSALLLSVLLIISCRKDPEIVSPLNGEDGLISYLSSSYWDVDINGKVNKGTSYTGGGTFLSSLSSQTATNVGVLSIGKIDVTTITGRYDFTSANRSDSNNAYQFGAITSFKISGGGGYKTASVDLYVPKSIFLDTVRPTCACSYPEISLSKLPYRIKWNTDPANQNGLDIMFEYDGTFGENADHALLDTFFINYAKASDIGYYDITAKDLQNIPAGAAIDLSVTRSNNGKMMSNGKSVSITAQAYTMRTYTIVP